MEYQSNDEVKRDTSKCAHLRTKLKLCLLETECCRVHKITPRECIRQRHPSVPQDCYALWNTFFECKHSILDGRRRFRGLKG